MHYIPDPRYGDDESESENVTVASRTSSRRGGRRMGKKVGVGGRRRSKPINPHQNNSTNNRDSFISNKTQQKAKRKLGGLMKRTFAKHKPAPVKTTTNEGATPAPALAGQSGDGPTEKDSLLFPVVDVIHCDPNTAESPSVTTNLSFNTPPRSRMHQKQQQHLSPVRSPPGYPAGPPPPPPSSHLLPSQPRSPLSSTTNTISNYNEFEHEHETPSQRAKRIKRAQDTIRQQMSYSLWQGLLAIFIYVLISIVCFSYWLEKKWTFLDSSYFAVVTFTTIGYGDVVPDTIDARLFTCVWALSGVSCLGIALGILGSNLIVVHEEEMEKVNSQRQTQVIGLFDDDTADTNSDCNNNNISSHNSTTASPSIPASSMGGYSAVEEGRRRVMYDIFDDSDDETNTRRNRNKRGKKGGGICDTWDSTATARLVRVVILLVFFFGLPYLISQYEGWGTITTVYYAIITASTVGYGDFSPKSEEGRVLAILYIPIAVCVMGFFLETVANAIIERRRQRYQSFLLNKPLELADIHILDSNGDGEVTRSEFLEFMLVAMDRVDKGLLDSLNEHFNRLDYDKSGTINKDDLAAKAQQRMDTVQGGFRLANYKDYQSYNTSPTSGIGVTGQKRKATGKTNNLRSNYYTADGGTAPPSHYRQQSSPTRLQTSTPYQYQRY